MQSWRGDGFLERNKKSLKSFLREGDNGEEADLKSLKGAASHQWAV
jgi:hypothetical protein